MTSQAHFGVRLSLVLALVTSACAGETDCTSCELNLTLGTLIDGEHVPHVAGERFPWEWGPQGGTMIVPALAFDPAEVAEGERVDVLLRHAPDPSAPEAFGQASDFPMSFTSAPVWLTPSGTPVVGPFFDQLGWSDLTGTRLILTVDATTERGREARVVTPLELTDAAPVDPACEPFLLVEQGCTYREIAGTATVTALVEPDPSAYSCDGGRRSELEFVADDPEGAAACVESLSTSPIEPVQTLTVGAGAYPPLDCLTAAGVEVGASFRATLRVIVRGGCSPRIFRAEVDLTGCVCQT